LRAPVAGSGATFGRIFATPCQPALLHRIAKASAKYVRREVSKDSEEFSGESYRWDETMACAGRGFVQSRRIAGLRL
jgi:hypothetical protein